MHEAIKDAVTICKTLLRNGFDAHVINAPLQEELLSAKNSRNRTPAVDIACEPDFETLSKLFPKIESVPDGRALASLEENGIIFRFYPLESGDAGHPELSLLRVTPTMAMQMDPEKQRELRITAYGTPPAPAGPYDGFAAMEEGEIRLLGLPDITLRHNYLLAIRALRFAANFDLPIEKNTWMAIVRSSGRVLTMCPRGTSWRNGARLRRNPCTVLCAFCTTPTFCRV